jgi:hypothetical protein
MMMIGPTHGTTWPTECTAEHLGENVVWISRKATLGSLGRSKLVKVLALLGIAQDLIGLLDLFELLRVTAFVRVVLSGKFAIGLFDIVLRRVSV